MRISNGIRKLEDGSIKAIGTIKPAASWLLRKTVMTTIAIVLVPTAVVSNAVVAALDTGARTGAVAINAIKEV